MSSLSERKSRIFKEIKEEMMAAGATGFTGAAAPEGPVAGYDPLMQKADKVIKKHRKKKGKPIAEATDGKSAKDKDYSLHDWFKGGGWKQAGGKYDGKPCAKQPGQTTKPFCRDADDRASMSKKERDSRAAKKRREDPNPDRKGKAKMVHEEHLEEKKNCWPGYEKKGTKKMFGKTYNNCVKKEETEVQESDIQEGKKDACYHKVKARYDVWPSAYASGALVKCRKSGAKNWGNKSKKKES